MQRKSQPVPPEGFFEGGLRVIYFAAHSRASRKSTLVYFCGVSAVLTRVRACCCGRLWFELVSIPIPTDENMNRILGSLSTLALCAAASAQCFDTNFGTQIGLGDDTLLAAQAIGFNFPIGATNYTHIIPNTNGVAFLHTAATGALGTTGTGYSTSAATMLTNLRGAAGGAPRLAAYWRDLNMLAANSGAVWANNSVANRYVLTWRNAVHFGQTAPVFTVQMQIFDTGAVHYFYTASTSNTAACPMVGVSVGGAIADPGISDLSVGASGVSTSKIVYQSFPLLNTFDLQIKTTAFVPNVGGGYDVISTPCVPAANANYGSGCPNVSATAYENFLANTIDLSNSSIRMTPTATGYAFTPGIGVNYTHTVAGLALGDDQNATLALPVPFNYPGGTTSSLNICSNGFIWMQANTSTDFSPTTAEIFSGAARLMPMWCDGVPDGVANLANVFAEVDAINNKAYVSWLNIPIFGGVGGTMNTQCEIDLTSGAVEYRYGAISCGNVCIVGWTPGTPVSVVNAGSIDISATLAAGFSTSSPEQRALTLASATPPVIGTTVTFTTNEVPATGLSFYLLSAGQYNPGLDLGVLGAPGCQAYITLPEVFSSLQIGSPSGSSSFGIPADPFFIGQSFYSQAAAVDPAANAFGFTTSNGVTSTMNAF